MQAYWASASGMRASLDSLDRIANNLANEETPGYAAQSGSFADTYTQALAPTATAAPVSGRYTPPGWWGGTGVMATNVTQDFTTSPLQTTSIPTDLAIQGNAFFVVQLPGGGTALTKAGDFQFAPIAGSQNQSMLVTPDGYPVLDTAGKPIVATGLQSTQMTVDGAGQIAWGSATGPRIAMATVPLPDNTLTQAGNNLYTLKPGTVTTIANAPVAAGGAGSTSGGGANTPGTAGADSMVQGALSTSNVDMATEMTNMLQAQQMFQLNAESLQFARQMNQTASTMKA